MQPAYSIILYAIDGFSSLTENADSANRGKQCVINLVCVCVYGSFLVNGGIAMIITALPHAVTIRL